jgi:hypothetical protein
MQKSIQVVGASSKTSNQYIRSYTWGWVWGSQEWLDPDNDGVWNWYRTDGAHHTFVAGVTGPADSYLTLIERPVTPLPMPGTTASGEGRVVIFEVRGALPHLTSAEVSYMSSHLQDFLGGEGGGFRCAVRYGSDFAYFLFADPSLPDVCSPGAFITIQMPPQVDPAILNQYFTPEALQILNTEHAPMAFSPGYASFSTIYEPLAAYEDTNMRVYNPVVSGSTILDLWMPWVPTNEDGSTGFFLTTDFLHTGGTFYMGPNVQGASGVAIIQQITGPAQVRISPAPYDFAHGDPLSYKYADKEKNIFIPVPDIEGNKSIGSQTTQSGGRYSETMLFTKEGMQTSTKIETFIPIPWAIPAPYSIRNIPYTSIWQRVSNPSIALNWDTLVYKVNGVEVTDQVQITFIPGGAELFYQPPVNFLLNSRVYVYVYVSASPSFVTSFLYDAHNYSRYIHVPDTSKFQGGGQLILGPNPVGITESNEVIAVDSAEEIMVNALQNEFIAGDPILYTYDDYPLELSYWFDIVDDFYPPRIINQYPYHLMNNVDVRHWIRFDVMDEGLGVDISTLSFTVNNMVVIPDIYKYSDNWYQVVYTPPEAFYYDSWIDCFVTVADLSSAQNRAFATWSFRTSSAEAPIILDPDPYYCAFPVGLKDDIHLDIYGRKGGANLHSLVFTIDQKKYDPISYPKIYRFK